MQQLLEGMDLSKSSLYQTFGDKQRLFDQCLQHYSQSRTEEMKRLLKEAPNAIRFIESRLMNIAGFAENPELARGCMVMNTATELGQQNAELAQTVKEGMDRFIVLFRKAVEQAQTEGDIRADRDAAQLATFIVSSMAGLNAMVKGGLAPTAAREVASTILDSLRAGVASKH